MIFAEVSMEEVSPSSSERSITQYVSEIESFCRLHRKIIGGSGLVETAVSSSWTPIMSKRRKRKLEEKNVPSNRTLRWKKMKKEVVSWLLPDDLAVSILAQLTRLDYANLAIVSKSFRSLVACPELWYERRLKGCTEEFLYLCLRLFDEPNPTWFIRTSKRRLSRLPTNPYQPQHSSSFLVVGSGIYVIGGIINGMPTSDVSLLDCCSHTWSKVPSMKMARASASARLVDEKIYVSGGCGEEADSEVFDIKTQTWTKFITSEMDHNINQGVVIEKKKKKKKEDPGFYFLPSESRTTYWTRGIDWGFDKGNISNCCAIGKLLYRHGTRGEILWSTSDMLQWEEVKGLEELKGCLVGALSSKLSTNSAGNLVIFWNTLGDKDPESLEIWSAEIFVKTHMIDYKIDDKIDEIWGRIIRSDVAEVLYSAPIYI